MLLKNKERKGPLFKLAEGQFREPKTGTTSMMFTNGNKKRLTTILCLVLAGLLILGTGCSQKLQNYSPQRKFASGQLQQDYDLLRDILEKFHPSLYWYTPKDSMDFYFDYFRSSLKDSMTEQQFGFRVLAPLITHIRCGHTSFNFSKPYTRFFRDRRLPSFPLLFKIWGDTMIVTANLNRGDSIIRPGTQLTSIDGLNARQLADTIFQYLPTDGFAENINYIRLSASFPYYQRNILGLKRQYEIGYIDSNLVEMKARVPVYIPPVDTGRKWKKVEAEHPKSKERRKQRMEEIRTLEIDSSLGLAVMTVNSFDGGGHLKSFFKSSFKTLREQGIRHLVIDLRSNGGGKVNHSANLARYLRCTPFRVADTAASIKRNFRGYSKYFDHNLINSVALFLFTSKYKDNRYHLRYWENHEYKPKKKYHFEGKTFVLINGPTFSAATLFCHTLQGQPNITLVGEETGGGNHGNNGLMIPNVTLPVTGIRVRVPMFRLVQYKHPPKDGRGVIPDIYIPPLAEAVRKKQDYKMEFIRDRIKEENSFSLK